MQSPVLPPLESAPESAPTPRPRRASWPFAWRFDTPTDATYAIRAGAGVAAFLAAVQIVGILTNIDGDWSVGRGIDALAYGVAAWFVMTTRSRIAAGAALVWYVGGQILLVVGSGTAWGYQVTPGFISVLITAALFQAFRATIYVRRLDVAPIA
jgi:hypothetical protein